jgi:hypothetical protein
MNLNRMNPNKNMGPDGLCRQNDLWADTKRIEGMLSEYMTGSSPSVDKSIYIIGSLRNTIIPEVANDLEKIGMKPFADWFGAGPEADDYWKEYNEKRGIPYERALDDYAARCVFGFDKHHLDRCASALLVLPAGKSGHLELGYSIGMGKHGYILADDKLGKERWDVMYAFAKKVFMTREEMLEYFKAE